MTKTIFLCSRVYQVGLLKSFSLHPAACKPKLSWTFTAVPKCFRFLHYLKFLGILGSKDSAWEDEPWDCNFRLKCGILVQYIWVKLGRRISVYMNSLLFNWVKYRFRSERVIDLYISLKLALPMFLDLK